MFFIVSGSYITMPITVVWLAINMGKGYKRTAALGILIPVGNAGAILSSNVFLTQETPVFRTGFSIGLGMNMLGILAAALLYLDCRWENTKKGKNNSL